MPRSGWPNLYTPMASGFRFTTRTWSITSVKLRSGLLGSASNGSALFSGYDTRLCTANGMLTVTIDIQERRC